MTLYIAANVLFQIAATIAGHEHTRNLLGLFQSPEGGKNAPKILMSQKCSRGGNTFCRPRRWVEGGRLGQPKVLFKKTGTFANIRDKNVSFLIKALGEGIAF